MTHVTDICSCPLHDILDGRRSGTMTEGHKKKWKERLALQASGIQVRTDGVIVKQVATCICQSRCIKCDTCGHWIYGSWSTHEKSHPKLLEQGTVALVVPPVQNHVVREIDLEISGVDLEAWVGKLEDAESDSRFYESQKRGLLIQLLDHLVAISVQGYSGGIEFVVANPEDRAWRLLVKELQVAQERESVDGLLSLLGAHERTIKSREELDELLANLFVILPGIG
mgnify:CR=1 FL=1